MKNQAIAITGQINAGAKISHVKHKFEHNLNESKHIMKYTIAHIIDGFRHSCGINVFGCNMDEYRHTGMTYRISFCPWNNFTDGTP